MKGNKLIGILAAAVALSCIPIDVAAQTFGQGKKESHQKYKVVDLGTLGGSFSQAFGVNNWGDVVGYATVSGDVSLHAFRWRDGLMTDLGVLGAQDTLPFSIAVEINDAGKVVGTSETSVPDPFGENFCGDGLICLPAVWRNGVIRPLHTLGGTNGVANDVNGYGVVGGSAENDIPDPTCTSPEVFHFEPVLWKKGRPIPLPLLGDDPDGFVLAVNDKGEAVGVTLDCSFNPGHSVFWRHGKALDMNTVGSDPTVEPNDLNNKAQVTGTAFSADGSVFAMRWQNGAIKILGALPGHVESHGNSINNRGQIVGQSCRAWPDCSVFFWKNGVMRDLNDLVSDTSLTLVESGKINDRGQIVGLAITNSGELHGFLATPHDDASDTTETSAALSKPQRPRIALPDVVQKTLGRPMRYKTRHFGRAVGSKNSR